MLTEFSQVGCELFTCTLVHGKQGVGNIGQISQIQAVVGFGQIVHTVPQLNEQTKAFPVTFHRQT